MQVLQPVFCVGRRCGGGNTLSARPVSRLGRVLSQVFRRRSNHSDRRREGAYQSASHRDGRIFFDDLCAWRTARSGVFLFRGGIRRRKRIFRRACARGARSWNCGGVYGFLSSCRKTLLPLPKNQAQSVCLQADGGGEEHSFDGLFGQRKSIILPRRARLRDHSDCGAGALWEGRQGGGANACFNGERRTGSARVRLRNGSSGLKGRHSKEGIPYDGQHCFTGIQTHFTFVDLGGGT